VIELRPLPFQDRSFPDESARGYALRMAERNGLRGLSQVAQVMKIRTLDFTDAATTAALAHLFGAEPRPLQFTAAIATDREGERRFCYMGHPVLRDWLFRSHRPQLCPHCLGEAAYIRADWELLLVTSCRSHGTLLVDRCDACLRPLTWSRPSLSRCRCGSDLRRQAGQPCLDQATSLWICKRLGLERRAIASSTAEHDVIASLSVDGLMRTVWGMGVKTEAAGLIPTGHVRRPFPTAELNDLSMRGRTRLEALIAGTPLVSSALHAPVFLALARDGHTLSDRVLAAQVAQRARARSWASSRLRDHHPGAQLALF